MAKIKEWAVVLAFLVLPPTAMWWALSRVYPPGKIQKVPDAEDGPSGKKIGPNDFFMEGVPLYPGATARMISSVSTIVMRSEGPFRDEDQPEYPKGYLGSLETNDSVATVFVYYKGELIRNGWTIESASNLFRNAKIEAKQGDAMICTIRISGVYGATVVNLEGKAK